MKLAVVAGFLLGIGTTAGVFADEDPAQGAAIGYSCLGCHGIDGYRNAYPSYRVPKLGGQKRAYVETALRAYRDGTREHPTMNAQSGSLSEQDIASVAAWLEQYGEIQDASTAESVAGIDAAKTCITCHGETGVGVAPQPPTLAGQHQDYLRHALQQYRSGERVNAVMSAFAAALTDEDIEAIALYYSSLDGLFTTEK